MLCKLESVQRCFTKRLPGLSDIPYRDRLVRLGLDSLELRRIRPDLVDVYKILFGLVEIDPNSLVTLYIGPSVRRQNYRLRSTYCVVLTLLFFFLAHRIINPWNALSSNINFSSLTAFKRTLKQASLSHFLTLNS